MIYTVINNFVFRPLQMMLEGRFFYAGIHLLS
jgi:hypothetical protein